MNGFSISDAAVEGFRVIGQRWRVLLGWGAFYLLGVVGLIAVAGVAAITMTLGAASPDEATERAGLIGGAAVAAGVGFIMVMLVTGTFRMMLAPQAPGFLHLRVGRDELRVLAAILLVILAAVPVVLVVRLALTLAGRVSPLLAIGAMIVLALGFAAVSARLWLATVIAFAERRVSLLEAWRRTAGQSWRLFGMVVLLFFLIAMIAFAAWLALLLLGGLLTGFGGFSLSDAETVSEHPGRYLLQLLAELMLTPFFLVIGQAPWVAVYRALTPARP
jgi:hypothetical protein